ncbi:sensor histidine kinase [Cohnella candidum]|uniref:sensor histidine kinase n=1 Tax=Cohnella candidum TaxID=2674991 RepID=UPI0013DDC214|nr:HAMP domain-containing sensor histidine kinase [Cohnella candidum]
MALLNAAVFLLVLAILGSLLYLHMRQRLYHETDEALKQAQNRLQSGHAFSELLRSDHPEPEQGEKTVYLFWDAQGKLVGQSPKQSFDERAAEQLKSGEGDKTIRTLTADKFHYRVLSVSNPNPAVESGVAAVTVAKSLGDADATLRLLLLDIFIVLLAGVVISVLAGLFLAERALVPIRRAWDKQQRFVADASHELRTPTAVIQAQTELLLGHPDHSIEQESPHIAVVLKESKRMGKLIDDLLTLARSDSNQLEIQTSAIELDALLSDVAEQFGFLADTRGIEVALNAEKHLVLWGDESRLRQLFVILLDNALKYTPPAGRIEIAALSHHHSVVIWVTDTGSGISEEDLPYVFERFYRGDKARSRTHGGTGLGLSIARWIVEAHGGTIRISSKVGEGTRVEIQFPRKHVSN